MLLLRNKFIVERRGTVRVQAQFRGRMVRKIVAATKVQSVYRRFVRLAAFTKLRSAVIALQNTQRTIMAQAIYASLRAEQKDIGKLKQNNEQLKAEMASLRAMLKAQADGAANDQMNQAALAEKQAEIDRLEARVKELEELLAIEKESVAKLEIEMKNRPTIAAAPLAPPVAASFAASSVPLPSSPTPTAAKKVLEPPTPSMPSPPLSPVYPNTTSDVNANHVAVSNANLVNSAELAKHLARIKQLEEELDQERYAHRIVDAQVVKLKAKMAGVELADEELENYVTGKEPEMNSGYNNTPSRSTEVEETPTKKKAQGLANIGASFKALAKRASVMRYVDVVPMIDFSLKEMLTWDRKFLLLLMYLFFSIIFLHRLRTKLLQLLSSQSDHLYFDVTSPFNKFDLSTISSSTLDDEFMFSNQPTNSLLSIIP